MWTTWCHRLSHIFCPRLQINMSPMFAYQDMLPCSLKLNMTVPMVCHNVWSMITHNFRTWNVVYSTGICRMPLRLQRCNPRAFPYPVVLCSAFKPTPLVWEAAIPIGVNVAVMRRRVVSYRWTHHYQCRPRFQLIKWKTSSILVPPKTSDVEK